MTTDNNHIDIIVAERGSDWTTWADRFRADAGRVVVVEQSRGESASAFAMRVRSRVSELDSLGEIIDRAAVLGGGRTDPDVMSSRSLTIRALVSPMVRAGRGRVFLGGQQRDRFPMLALASAVAEMLRGTGVKVAPAGADAPLAAA